MPPVVAAVAGAAISSAAAGALVSAGLTATIAGFSVASIAGSIVGGIASSFIGGALAGGGRNSQAFSKEAEGFRTLIRSSVETHKILYGNRRISGAPVLIDTRTGGNAKRADTAALGQIIYDSSRENQFCHIVIPLVGHEIQDVATLFIDDIGYDWATKIDSNGFLYDFSRAGEVRESIYYFCVMAFKFLGTTTQLGSQQLASETGLTSPSTHRLAGIGYVYTRLQYQAEVFPNGIPQLSFRVLGKKLYDPRTGATVSYPQSSNAALCALDYIRSPYGLGIPDSAIDFDSFKAAANICDENVTTIAGVQKRYTFDGILDTAAQRVDNLRQIADAMAGYIIYSQGKYKAIAGAFETPVLTIDDSWLAGDLRVDTQLPKRDKFNTVKGVFIDPNQGWQPVDYPQVVDATALADDGEELVRDMPVPFALNSIHAQRMAQIAVKRSRQAITVSIPCNFKALQVEAGDMVAITNSYLGWSAKPFRVLRWDLAPSMSGVMLTCQEEAAATYDWNPASGIVPDPAPDTNLPNPFVVAPPSDLAITESVAVFNAIGGVTSQATLGWRLSPDAFVNNYEAQYKLTSVTSYTSIGSTGGNSIDIINIQPNIYDFRVRAVNSIGQKSVWVNLRKEIFAQKEPPNAIQNFSLNEIAGAAHLSWDQSDNLSVRVAGQIRVRYTPALTGAVWSDAIDITPALAGVATSAVVPLLAGTYLIKPVDGFGQESEAATTIISTIANVVGMNAVATSQQDAAFAGTKTNMIVSGGKLTLDASGLFDATAGNFDARAGLFDAAGGANQTSGEYIFDNYIDLGDVYTSRVLVDIEQQIFDSSASFDETLGLFDDASGLFDGTENADIKVKIFVRTTNDDPAGTPTWSEWRQFIVGDYTARAFEFKLTVESGNSSYNVEISRLRVDVDVPDRVESAEDVASLAAGTTITYSKEFFTAPTVEVTAQNMATGDYYAITAKTTTGFTIRFFNAAGTGVIRTFDWVARGY